LAKEFGDAGWSMALDANCGSKNSFPYIQKYLNENNIKSIWIRVAPPNEFIVSKLRNYKHTWLFKDGDDAVRVFEHNLKENGNFENLPVEYVYTFGTSKNNLSEQIEEAVHIICNMLN